MSQDYIQLLQSLPLETRARLQKKSFGSLYFIIIALGVAVGLFYWFVHPFIFSYYSVKPFLGFTIFLAAGIVLSFIIFEIISAYYKEYDSIIDNALATIKEIIDNGNPESIEQYLLYKSILIESKVRSNSITKDEFNWYTSHFCWGCGQKHRDKPMQFNVSREKEETWRSGPFRKYQRFSITAPVLLCPDCYEKIKELESPEKSILSIIPFFTKRKKIRTHLSLDDIPAIKKFMQEKQHK